MFSEDEYLLKYYLFVPFLVYWSSKTEFKKLKLLEFYSKSKSIKYLLLIHSSKAFNSKLRWSYYYGYY